MAVTHKTDAPVVPSNPADEFDTVNFDAYVQEANLPQYAVPVVPSLSFPIIRYHKNVLVVSGKKPAKATVWHVGMGQNAEVDNLFDHANIPTARVRHHSGNEEEYWQLDSLIGYLLFKSVPEGYSADSWKTSGIPYVWNDYKDTHCYGSQMQMLFFLKGLLTQGYTQPLVLSFSRTITEPIVSNVLQCHAGMLSAIKKKFAQKNIAVDPSSYAYWVELIKGDEEVLTKGGGSYYPPVLTMPSPLTVNYVREHQADPAHIEAIEGFLPQWDQWAETASARLLEPPRERETSASATNDTSAATEPEPPADEWTPPLD